MKTQPYKTNMKISIYPALNTLILLCVCCFSAADSFAQDKRISDFEESIKSPSILNPEHAKIKSRVSYVPGIKVIRGETQLIVPEQKHFCPAGSVFKYNNRDIHVYDKRSSDGGKTWKQTEYILENSTYQYPEPDGEVIMFRSENSAGGESNAGRPEISLQKTDIKGVLEANFIRSNDNGLTRAKDPAKIYMPEEFSEWTGVLCRKIVRLADGSLLMSMYSRNTKGNDIEQQFRTFALNSKDRGKTWHYISTIAFDLKEDTRGEGFDEPSLLVLSDGRILSFMRSGASYQASLGSFNNNDWGTKMPFSYGKQTPVYMSISSDEGKNWSNADPITTFGVWPNAIQLENGIIAVGYGRPGNWLMFNDNESESWGPVIPFYNDLYPPDCGNYFSMAEVAPNVMLVVYSRTNPNNHWKSEIVGTYFHVKRIVE
jgi:hypothetical protein